MTKLFSPKGFPSPAGPIVFLGLATLSQTGVSFVQQGVIVMGIFFVAVYHLNLAELGLISSGLFLGMMVGAIFTGFLVDRMGPKWVLFGGALVMAGLTLGLEVVSGFAELLAMLVVVGMGISRDPVCRPEGCVRCLPRPPARNGYGPSPNRRTHRCRAGRGFATGLGVSIWTSESLCLRCCGITVSGLGLCRCYGSEPRLASSQSQSTA